MSDDKQPANEALPPYDPSQPHLLKPHLRRFLPQPGKQPDGTQVLCLADPLRLHRQQMVVPAQAMPILAQFQGQQTVDEVAEKFQIPIEGLQNLVMALEVHCMLWGPTFTEMEAQKKRQIDELGYMPRGAAFMLGEDGEAMRTQLAEWLEQAEDPELGVTPTGIVVPHLDYHRGWPLYAAGYRAWMGAPRPDRVIVLGTSHHGIGDGVVGTRWHWETPLGMTAPDHDLMGEFSDRLGEGLIADQLDHVPEHSIQLHLPWIQHLFGDVPVSGFLVPDPMQPMISDDGNRTSLIEFTSACRESLESLGGTTYFVASSDLSHVGPQFGDPEPIDESRREAVEMYDRTMLGHFLAGDAESFVTAIAESENSTNWCSIGNMSALLRILDGTREIELLDYRQAFDESNHWLVSASTCALI